MAVLAAAVLALVGIIIGVPLVLSALSGNGSSLQQSPMPTTSSQNGSVVSFDNGTPQLTPVAPTEAPAAPPADGTSESGNSGGTNSTPAYRECMAKMNSFGAQLSVLAPSANNANMAFTQFQIANSGVDISADPALQAEYDRLQSEAYAANAALDGLYAQYPYSSWGCNQDGMWSTPR